MLGLLAFACAARAQDRTETIRAVLVDSDADFVPDRMRDTVEVEGIFLSDPFAIGGDVAIANLQDATGGVTLFSRDTSLFVRGFVRGDRARVRGVVDQYAGAEQIDVRSIELLERGAPPAPTAVHAAEVAGEMYSGRLVRLTGRLRVTEEESGFLTVELQDSSGSIPVWISSRFLSDPEFVEALRRGGEAEITGIATQSKEEPPFDSGYRIIPRDPGDVVLAPVPPYREAAFAGIALVLVAGLVILWVRRRTAERSAREMSELATKLEEAGTALERERAYLQAVIDASPDGIFVKDRDGRFTIVNGAMADLYGSSAKVMVGRNDAELGLVRTEVDHLVEPEQEVLETGRALTGMVEFTDPRTGEIRWFEQRKVALSLPGGDRHLLAIATDVTERRRAEEEVRVQAAAMDASSDGIAILGPDERFVYVNQAHARIYGYESSQDLIGKTWRDLYSADEVARLERESFPILQATGRWTGEAVGKRRDGDTFPQELSLAATADRGVVCVARDTTERKQLEDQLRWSQRMEALGRLAGGVAHDFNNLLHVITGNMTLASERLGEGHPVQEDLQEIGNASRRAGKLVQQLLAFSRNQEVRGAVVALNAVVAETETMLRRLLGTDIEMVTVLEPELWPVQADLGQIEQILVNLAVNARDAMPDGGVLMIETQNVEIGADRPTPFGRIPPGRYALLEIRDTGTGIDQPTMQRIFEPFYSTKESGKGTGLGLSIVHGILEQHGGHVDVESRPGAGSTFRIYLPESAAPVGARPEPVAETPGLRASGERTLLVVDDEQMVRRIATRVLARSGYSVLEASNGEEAVRLATTHQGRIDVVLTDVVMPLMGGRELAEKIRSIRPGTPVIYMSGYNEESLVETSGAETTTFLAKPFAPALLVETVERALSRTP